MKRLLLSVFLLILLHAAVFSQNICNPAGNLIIFSNYDGGVLNINVDANIPNLKIGIVSYESATINLSGAFVNNVDAVVYAGFQATNAHCGQLIPATTVNGAPAQATVSILTMPPSPVPDPNGYPLIICAFDCDTTTSQGGCNTVTQVNAFFLNQFPGSVLRFHHTQYGCWSGVRNVSAGGNCCPPTQPLAFTFTVTPLSCFGSCDGDIQLNVTGGFPPYSYQWSGIPPTATGYCAGLYTVTVTDSLGNSVTNSVFLNQPDPITSNPQVTACNFYVIGGDTLYSSGSFFYALTAANGCDSLVSLQLTVDTALASIWTSNDTLFTLSGYGSYQWIDCSTGLPISGEDSAYFVPAVSGSYAAVVFNGSCSDTSECISVIIQSIPQAENGLMLQLIPAGNGNFILKSVPLLVNQKLMLYDLTGREIFFGFISQSEQVLPLSNLSPGIYILRIPQSGIKIKLALIR